MVAVQTFRDREEWLEQRKNGIGGSEAAAALGEDMWRSRFRLWHEKTGRITVEENERMIWGRMLEPGVVAGYRHLTGRTAVQTPEWTIWSDRDEGGPEWRLATLDATQRRTERDPEWIPSSQGVLQVKTAGLHYASSWEEEGPPLGYQIQLQHEMAASGMTWGTLGCLVGGQKLLVFDFSRDDEFLSRTRKPLDEFWRYVREDREPPADSSESTRDALGQLYPRSVAGSVIDLPESLLVFWEARERWKAELAELEKSIRGAEARIKQAMGDAEHARLGERLLSWKSYEVAEHTVETHTRRPMRECQKWPKHLKNS